MYPLWICKKNTDFYIENTYVLQIRVKLWGHGNAHYLNVNVPSRPIFLIPRDENALLPTKRRGEFVVLQIFYF